MEKRVIRILNHTGDVAIEWQPGVETEEKEAERTFDRLAQAGYLMFAIEAPGKQAEQVRTFDPKAFEIVAAPRFKGG